VTPYCNTFPLPPNRNWRPNSNQQAKECHFRSIQGSEIASGNGIRLPHVGVNKFERIKFIAAAEEKEKERLAQTKNMLPMAIPQLLSQSKWEFSL
jgi:hypothetical protein